MDAQENHFHSVSYARLRKTLKRLGLSIKETTWKGAQHRYHFQCWKGHTFNSTPKAVSSLISCRQCRQDHCLEKLAAKVRRMGMVLLDTAWAGASHLYRMRCAEGHEQYTKANIRDVTQCRLCSQNLLLTKIASRMRRYGLTLAESGWQGKTALYRMHCKKGHELYIRGNLSTGVRCEECLHERRLRKLTAAVRPDGRVVVGSALHDRQRRYRMRCAEGHEEELTFHAAVSLTNCRVCTKLKRGGTAQVRARFAEAEQAIRQAGFRFLGRRKVNDEVFFHIQCPESHLYRLPSLAVFAGQLGCTACADEQAQTHLIRARHLSNGIKLLNIQWTYTGNRQRLECSNGHVWNYRPGRDANEIPHCAECAGAQDGERLKANAAAANIIWLDKEWKGPFGSHGFRCAAGHTWQLSGASAARALDCPRCKQQNWEKRALLQEGLDRFRFALDYRRGSCLGPAYSGAEVQYLLRCSWGHEWHSTASAIIRGGWCVACTGPTPVAPKDLAKLQLIAGLRGGKCLETRFTDNQHRYRFSCAAQHEWYSRATAIHQGTWCRLCAEAKRAALCAPTDPSAAA